MIETITYSDSNKPSESRKNEIIDFLFEHLGNYGDPRPDIEKAVNYALKETVSFGGFVIVAYLEGNIAGAAVVNQTGMQDYIPENILVYIATDTSLRGKGIGTQLLQKVIDTAEGDIALHLDTDNPARSLYERIGFKVKYLEMRLLKKNKK
jgi:GNAT superfamily N-acetyltransferase